MTSLSLAIGLQIASERAGQRLDCRVLCVFCIDEECKRRGLTDPRTLRRLPAGYECTRCLHLGDTCFVTFDADKEATS